MLGVILPTGVIAGAATSLPVDGEHADVRLSASAQLHGVRRRRASVRVVLGEPLVLESAQRVLVRDGHHQLFGELPPPPVTCFAFLG